MLLDGKRNCNLGWCARSLSTKWWRSGCHGDGRVEWLCRKHFLVISTFSSLSIITYGYTFLNWTQNKSKNNKSFNCHSEIAVSPRERSSGYRTRCWRVTGGGWTELRCITRDFSRMSLVGRLFRTMLRANRHGEWNDTPTSYTRPYLCSSLGS